jgi:hypothetical protein
VIFAILAGLVVAGALGWLGRMIWRTWTQVRDFARTVSAAGGRLADASAGLDTATAHRDAERRDHVDR